MVKKANKFARKATKSAGAICKKSPKKEKAKGKKKQGSSKAQIENEEMYNVSFDSPAPADLALF